MLVMEHERRRPAYVQYTVRFNEEESQRVDRAIRRSGLSMQRFLLQATLAAVAAGELDEAEDEKQ